MATIKNLIIFLLLLPCFAIAQSSNLTNAEADKLAGEFFKASEEFNKGNYKESIPTLKRASAAGIFMATDYLGRAWEEGKAYPQNYEMAFKYYKCAAENGFYPGMYKTSYFYSEGLGVQQNYQESYFWLILAIPNYEKSKQKSFLDLRDLIAKRLNASQVQEAQSRAKSWKPKNQVCTFE